MFDCLPTQAQTPEGTRGWPFASTTHHSPLHTLSHYPTILQSLCRQCPSLFRIDQSHVQQYHLTFQGVLPPSVWFGVNRPADSPIHRITVGAYNSLSPQAAFHSLRLMPHENYQVSVDASHQLIQSSLILSHLLLPWPALFPLFCARPH